MNLKKHIEFLLNCIILAGLFFVLHYINSDAGLTCEDTSFYPINWILSREELYIFKFLPHLFLFLPAKLFQINIYSILPVWLTTMCIFVCFLVFLYSKLIYNNRIIKIFALFFTALFTILSICENYSCIKLIEESYIFVRYTITLGLFLLCEYAYFKNLIEFDGKSRKYDIISALSIVLISTSTEIFFLEILIQFTIITILSFIKKLQITPPLNYSGWYGIYFEN